MDKWIPVSERLPEENETVLINYCRLNERSVWMAIWDELHCRFYNSEYTKYVSVDFVTAWMPLPEPYEPQESGDKERIKAIPSAEPNMTWVTGADGAKIAFKDVPVWKAIKICEILGEPQESEE